ncbi:hypothetical protein DSECCO2_120560 [anaerobic digester metagenome]
MFKNTKMNFQAARPGTRTTGSSKPEFKLLGVFNRFQLNSVASKVTGAKNGDFITIFVDSEAPFEEGYAIAINADPKNQAKLAAVKGKEGVGRKLTFNYSGVYSQMLQKSPAANEASAAGLVEMGLMHTNTTKEGNVTYLANESIIFEVGEGFEYEISEGKTITMYPLINPNVEVNDDNFAGDNTDDED